MSTQATRPPLNPREPLVGPPALSGQTLDRNRLPSDTFLIYMRGLNQQLDAAPAGFDPVALVNQSAAIPTTALPTNGDLSAGLYRVNWYGQVMTPAGISSSFQVTLGWTLNAVVQSFTGALNNGNLTTTREFNGVQLIAIDAASPITYTVTYASNPAAAMKFNLFLTLERLAALATA